MFRAGGSIVFARSPYRRRPPFTWLFPPFAAVLMKFDSKFWQRAFLAFTTGLFLSCAARMSEQGTLPSAASFSIQP
jgi:hypothetical protein